MGQFILSAEASFSAAHRLPDVDRCDQSHGHNWRVRVSVLVEELALTSQGMGVDFRTTEQVTKEAASEFDHAYLNGLEAFSETSLTGERVVKLVYKRASERLQQVAPDASVVEVEAREMPGFRAVYRP